MPWQLSRTSEYSLTEILIQTKVDGILHTRYAGTGRLGADTEYGVHVYIQRRDMGLSSKCLHTGEGVNQPRPVYVHCRLECTQFRYVKMPFG
jgi:hypothetical protein